MNEYLDPLYLQHTEETFKIIVLIKLRTLKTFSNDSPTISET